MSQDAESAGQYPSTPSQRPIFTPPPGYPPQPLDRTYGSDVAQSAPSDVGLASILVGIGAAAVMLLAGFLPWLNVDWAGGIMGTVVSGTPSDYSGIRADGTGSMVTLSGCAALGLVLAGLATRRSRTAAMAGIPGGVALLACMIFALRQQQLGDRLTGGLSGNFLNIRLTLGYGWYLALAASFVALGLGLLTAAKKGTKG